tara:strand:+ start:235 stop:510 length:276 start_codon:yes stop_codon:yes gene_type:complete
MNTNNEIKAMILNMDNDDLNELIDVIKLRRNQISSDAKKKFKVGDKVFFVSKKVGKVSGNVIKINPKYILIDQTNGMSEWRVSPTLLKKEI